MLLKSFGILRRFREQWRPSVRVFFHAWNIAKLYGSLLKKCTRFWTHHKHVECGKEILVELSRRKRTLNISERLVFFWLDLFQESLLTHPTPGLPKNIQRTGSSRRAHWEVLAEATLAAELLPNRLVLCAYVFLLHLYLRFRIRSRALNILIMWSNSLIYHIF